MVLFAFASGGVCYPAVVPPTVPRGATCGAPLSLRLLEFDSDSPGI